MRDYRYRNKEWLFHQYVDLKKSIRDIAKICNVGSTTILNWLKKFEIPRRTLSESIKKSYKNHSEKWKKSEEFKQNCKLRKGDKSGAWKGDNAEYTAIHDWLRKYKPKPNPKNCEEIGRASCRERV